MLSQDYQPILSSVSINTVFLIHEIQCYPGSKDPVNKKVMNSKLPNQPNYQILLHKNISLI